ncbi:DUF4386 domain-containing protein [Pedococcus sp. 5OH_020]|uniref:DUF4386 domain-containing protein n=1 Tax=Pedococcus sp. 5OH_020 TaxID=2989814 RepID=UPI0022E9E754|nr:DUF4386 domain-containing protein [Pedococcus sp. 5OH_020]
MRYSRSIGGLFIAGFLTYGIGALMTTSVTGNESFLATVPSHRGILVLGALLMLANTAVDIGKAVLFFPVIEPHGRRTALAYLATMIFEVALMAVGVLALLVLPPLADQAASGHLNQGTAQSLGSLAVDGNELAYQVGQLSLGFGAMFLAYLLFRTGLIPRALAGLGVVGYATHVAGAIFELFGVHISMWLLIPGGIFEVTLGAWLLVKGFNATVYRKDPRRVAVSA